MNEDSASFITDPDLHDGHLTGIQLVGTRTLELSCSSLDGERYVIRLLGLDRLRVDNFLEGNIIFEIALYEPPFPMSSVKKVFGIEDKDDPDWLKARVAAMADQNWRLLELSSSYGCELLALAHGSLEVNRLA